jgi:general secretion pathway protein F
LPLDRSLQIVIGLLGQRRLGRTLGQILAQISDGASLAEALDNTEAAFPRIYVGMVRAGETAGTLADSLRRLAAFLAKAEARRQAVLSALVYPAVLAVVAAGSVAIVLGVVLPQFKPMFAESGAAMPWPMRILMGLGDLLAAQWQMIPVGVLVAVACWQGLMTRPLWAWRRDRLLLALPLMKSLLIKLDVARFARLLGTLLSGGIAVSSALTLCAGAIENRVIAGAVAEVATRLKEGEGLAGPLAETGWFPDLSVQMVRIGEETARMEEMLGQVAETYDQEVERSLARLINLLVPVLTIGMGLVVAFIISAVVMAVARINDLAQ